MHSTLGPRTQDVIHRFSASDALGLAPCVDHIHYLSRAGATQFNVVGRSHVGYPVGSSVSASVGCETVQSHCVGQMALGPRAGIEVAATDVINDRVHVVAIEPRRIRDSAIAHVQVVAHPAHFQDLLIARAVVTASHLSGVGPVENSWFTPNARGGRAENGVDKRLADRNGALRMVARAVIAAPTLLAPHHALAFTGALNLSQTGSALSLPAVTASSWSCRSTGGYSPQVQTLLATMPSRRAISDWEPKCLTACDVFMTRDYGPTHMGLPINFSYRETNVEPMETIGARIKALRGKKFTQTTLGKAVGVDQSVISDIERGAGFKADLLMKICDALETTAEYLMRGGVINDELARDLATAHKMLSGMTPEVRRIALASLGGMAVSKSSLVRLAASWPPSAPTASSTDEEVRAARERKRKKNERHQN